MNNFLKKTDIITMKKLYKSTLCLLILLVTCFSCGFTKPTFIKWVDCNVSSEILNKAIEFNIKHHDNEEINSSLVYSLSYLALKNGNSFSLKADTQNFKTLTSKLENGEDVYEKYTDNKYFNYYLESYEALFGNLLGEYKEDQSNDIKFGVRAYFPLAKGFWYNDYDDFGNSRSFGFKRKHLGHDLMGGVGTPIVATENGTVTELGWNRYGGWRVGIRTTDSKRFYYYAHLRKGRPYAEGLKKGDTVEAGQVIGYLGNTGYSNQSDKNLSSCPPHLHFGLQLIFDESQVSGNNEIWVDVYQICRTLSKYRATVQKNEETKEYTTVNRKIWV